MSKFTSFIHKFFDKKTLKFLAVGVINTVVGAGTMFILYNLLHVNYWVSTAMNYVAICIVSYFLNNFWTFGYKDKSFKTVLKFILTVVVCYAIAYGAAKILIKLILSEHSKKIQENLAMVAGMVLYPVLNYVGQRFFAFAKLKAGKKSAAETEAAATREETEEEVSEQEQE